MHALEEASKSRPIFHEVPVEHNSRLGSSSLLIVSRCMDKNTMIAFTHSEDLWQAWNRVIEIHRIHASVASYWLAEHRVITNNNE
jgi:hypothetical protein